VSAEFEFPPRPVLAPRGEPFRVGDTAPDFTLPAVDPDGRLVSFIFSEYLGESRGLLIFYQDDGMPICTRELQAFTQEFARLEAGGIRVAAINTNGIGSHEKFQERDHYPFPLISDFYGDVVKAYGMWDPDDRKSLRGAIAVGPRLRVNYVLPYFNPGNVNAFVEVFEGLGLTQV